MSKFIVIEGLDGAGKSTQIKLLKDFFNEKRLKCKCIHFPRTESPIYGEMIAKFLRGEFGSVNEVNPYFVALLYAGDRNDAKEMLAKWLRQNDFLIADRYYYSNVAFQGAKISELQEKISFRKWINELEIKYNKIPMPDLSIYLHLPFEIVVNRLSTDRQGASRNYLSGKTDIHESSFELQKKVEWEYLDLASNNNDFFIINCADGDVILNPEQIHLRIINLLRGKKVI
ncbi:MAG: dTMP kinase [Firmicutes bacterium]|nr:dTMP kinase [Bacillota bacterium]